MVQCCGRCSNKKAKQKEKTLWTFASSVWAPQYPETDELLDRCFWKDWALLTEKMEKVFKINPEMSETLQQAIRINYKFLYTLYRRYSWMGVPPCAKPT